MKRRCYAEINLDVLLQNLHIYQSSSMSDKIIAVVKANAYGHGDRMVAKLLSDNGIKYFAVSNIDEAIHIREAGVSGEILVLGYTPINRVEELVLYDITQALISEEYAGKISESGFLGKCQFAIDTGMRRIGLNADCPEYCERLIRQYSGKINLNGLFTHLCVADSNDEKSRVFTRKQIELFENICDRVTDLNLQYLHCMNSAGGLWYNSNRFHLTRLGIILYGLKPSYMNELPEGIEPVLSWKSVVSMVKQVKRGDTIGYGRTFTAEREMTIATIPTGYADGYSRLLSNKGWVLIRGQKAPIVGNICMDQMMVNITDIPNVQMEDEVILLGRSRSEAITADDLAQLYGTIGYEVVCGIAERVERVYKQCSI